MMMSMHADASVDLRALARTGVVHFMGVTGAGMSALAELLVRGGGRVSGCDMRPGASAAVLQQQGIAIAGGHDAAHVQDAAALVITSAIAPDHPELQAARARGIPVLKRAEALGAMINQGVVLAVAGTHGKTTTTAAATAILAAADLDPTGLVGGRVHAWGGGLRVGESDLFVVEADEYDRSFLTLRPAAAVITNVEADHLDIYGDLAGLEQGFADFLAHVQPNGLVAACSDDVGARHVTRGITAPRTLLTYGTGASAHLRAVEIRQEGRAMIFTVVEGGTKLGVVTLAAPGMHNVRNALGAFALARHAGATFEAAQHALREFTGVARRFQEVGTASGVSVIDDYAHHPTEVAATLAAARAMYPQRRIIAAFQPHLYSRTRDHAEDFGQALAAADAVWVADVYPAREQAIPGITGELVARAAAACGTAAVRYTPSLEEMSQALLMTLQPNDVLVAMGAGDIDEMAHGLFAQLQQAAQ